MIGKPEWFTRRKYGGWGLSVKTWQGWVYIAAFIIPIIIFQSIPYWDTLTRTAVTIIWGLILIVDAVDMMIKMKKDEREKIHEAIAERNAMWAITIILSLDLVYQVSRSAILKSFQIDWFLVGALIVGLIIKCVSNIYLDKKN